MNLAEWFAADFAGTLLDIVIEVTKTEKKENGKRLLPEKAKTSLDR